MLHVGAEAGDKKVVELLLLELKAHLEGKDHAGRTPVLVAVMNGHEHVAVFLAEQKANLFAGLQSRHTCNTCSFLRKC